MSPAYWGGLAAFFLAVGVFACWLARRQEKARQLIMLDLLNHGHIDIGAVKDRTKLSARTFNGALLDLREMGLVRPVQKTPECTKDGCGCLDLRPYELTEWGKTHAEYLQHAGEVGA